MPESTPLSPELLPPDAAAALVEFARGCKAAVRAVSLYPGQHPAISASLSRLVQATARLTTHGPLELHVHPDNLLIGGAALPKEDQGVRELAELLHRHLIGGLTINAAADAESWRTLLLLLSRAPEDVRADGGIGHLWSKAGGPTVEIHEIDYAEVLRDKRGAGATIDAIIAAAMGGAPLRLEEEELQALMALLNDPTQVDEMMSRLDSAAKGQGMDAKTAAVMTLLRNIVEEARKGDPGQLEEVLRRLGAVASRLAPNEMLQLIAQREQATPEGETARAVLDHMPDKEVAHFVARSVEKERGASGRLAHAFQALAQDADRQRHLLALAEEQAAASPLGKEAGFDELWDRVENMVASYSDDSFVSAAYARELDAAQTRAVDLEQTSEDPPERMAAWIATVSDASLRGLDHRLLLDLLTIEHNAARWRDVAETAVAHADDLVRVGHFPQAWELADTVTREGTRLPERAPLLPELLQRLGRGPMLKHAAAYLRSADDDGYGRFERMCHAMGTPVIAPLAEALSLEQDARSRRRLRDVLVGFGARGRDVVQQLMHAPNWEVRRTAAFLLREFGGSEGLKELIPLLTDSEPLVQREAVQGLVFNGTTAAGAILVQALHTSSGRIRETLVQELAGIRDAKAAPLYSHIVRNLNRTKHPQVYLAALEALGAFADADSIDALKTALYRSDFWAPRQTGRARAAAAAALRRIGTPQALDVLRAAATKGDRGTRSVARSTLSQLG